MSSNTSIKCSPYNKQYFTPRSNATLMLKNDSQTEYSNPLLTCYISYSLIKKRFQSHMSHLIAYSKALNKDIVKIILGLLWKRTLWTSKQQMLMSWVLPVTSSDLLQNSCIRTFKLLFFFFFFHCQLSVTSWKETLSSTCLLGIQHHSPPTQPIQNGTHTGNVTLFNFDFPSVSNSTTFQLQFQKSAKFVVFMPALLFTLILLSLLLPCC